MPTLKNMCLAVNGGVPGLLLGDTATLGSTTPPTTVTLDVPVTLSSLTLNSTNAYTLNNTGTNSLTLQAAPSLHALIDSSNSDHIISAPLNANSPLDIITNSGSLTLAGNLQVAPGTIVSKTGNGSLIIAGPQNWGAGSVLQIGGSYPLASEMMNYSGSSASNTPEPSTWAMLASAGFAGAGVAAYSALRSRRRKKDGKDE